MRRPAFNDAGYRGWRARRIGPWMQQRARDTRGGRYTFYAPPASPREVNHLSSLAQGTALSHPLERSGQSARERDFRAHPALTFARELNQDVATGMRHEPFGTTQRTERGCDAHAAKSGAGWAHTEDGGEQPIIRMRCPCVRIGARRFRIFGR